MKIIGPHTSKASESITTGEVYTTILTNGDETSQLRIARMHFAPEARTAWHSHAGGEYLHILEGKALVQERGGEVTILYAGDTMYTEPNVEHWHGAASDTFMSHLAIWGAPVTDDDQPETKWGEQVSDEEMNSENKSESDQDKDQDKDSASEEE